MVQKCIYCKGSITEESALDVCERCGTAVWGPKMFMAIKSSMAASKERGDLDQGSVD